MWSPSTHSLPNFLFQKETPSSCRIESWLTSMLTLISAHVVFQVLTLYRECSFLFGSGFVFFFCFLREPILFDCMFVLNWTLFFQTPGLRARAGRLQWFAEKCIAAQQVRIAHARLCSCLDTYSCSPAREFLLARWSLLKTWWIWLQSCSNVTETKCTTTCCASAVSSLWHVKKNKKMQMCTRIQLCLWSCTAGVKVSGWFW